MERGCVPFSARRITDGRAAIRHGVSVSDPAPVLPGSVSVGQFIALIARFVFGFAVPFGCALRLLQRPAWTFSALDAVFWCSLAVFVVLLRLAAQTESEGRRWRTVA